MERSSSSGEGAPQAGVRCQSGFTLIEVMVVTLILGILAAIMMPRVASTREQAHFAAIAQDLRNLGASQERYFQRNTVYAANVGLLDFTATPGVNIEVTEATPQGWAAVATHEALEDLQGCSIYLGNATAPPLPNGSAHTAGPGVSECAR